MQTIFVIFGSTGDLAKRKLFPALYNIYQNKRQKIDIISVGRRDFDKKGFLKYIDEETNNFIEDKSEFNNFLDTISYSKVEINNKNDYFNLKKNIAEIQTFDSQVIFYLSIAPEHFCGFINNYKEIGIKNAKIIFEKPFGVDLISAKKLNENIMKVFSENQVYRIDHYLAKEAVQNIITLRFANIIFESIWSNKYIDNIQITASEDIGVGDRGSYYEKSGALRDMLQNHLFQMLSLITMDIPSGIDAFSIGEKKLDILKHINLENNLLDNVIFGQYKGYKNEKGVNPNSNTETFVALKLEINNKSFSGVPIYIKTGKYLDKKSTLIVIELKKVYNTLFKEHGNIERNRIILEIQPNEDINIHFNIKENGNRNKIQKIKSSFIKRQPSQESYEKLIQDVILGDKTLFTSWDILEQSWKIVDNIINCNNNCPIVLKYDKGSIGPLAADKLLDKDGRKWYVYDNSNTR